MKIAVLGGGFNPPTRAYEEIADLVLNEYGIGKVLLIPYKQTNSKR